MDIENNPFVACQVPAKVPVPSFKPGKLRGRLEGRKSFLLGCLVVVLALAVNRSFPATNGLENAFATSTSRLYKFVTVNVVDEPPLYATDKSGSGSNATLSSAVNITAELAADIVEPADEDREIGSFEIPWGKIENYQSVAKIGEGTYAEVFLSKDLRNGKPCVAKVLQPVSKRRVKREIKILQELSGGPNILTLIDAVKEEETNQPWIVTEFINNTHYRTLYPELTDLDIRFYLFQLLRAIEHAHKHNIMHRDIKPQNVMIDNESHKLRLIDWGLSDYYDENYAYTTNVASRFWRAPELLVDYEWYNLSVDMWSFGCMLAGLIFQKQPFFRGRHDDVNQLVKITKVLGTEGLLKWLTKYNIELDDRFDSVTGWHESKSWDSFVNDQNWRLANQEAVDLVSRVLVYDHRERLTATEALGHAYFDPIRENARAHDGAFTTWTV